MRGSICAFGAVLITLVSVGVRAMGSDLSEERVSAVEAMLSPQPAGVGRPITDRAAWEEMAGHQASRDVVGRAERLLGEPLPETTDELFLDFSRTGNRTRWQAVAFRRRGRLKPLALAECLENKGRFLPALEEVIRSLCAERTWVGTAHDRSLANFRGESVDIDLLSSALAWELATVDYLLGDRLAPETRDLLRANVRSRVLDPYLDMVAGRRVPNWWMGTTNNWNAVCLAGVTGAALALAESPRERATFIVAAEELSKNFLRGFPPDGYCTEGLGYWNYGFGHYVLLAEALYQATGGGVDLMARPQIAAIATYPPRLEILGGVYPALADCPVGVQPSARILGYASRRLGLGLRRYETDEPVSWEGPLFEALLYAFPNSASAAPPADHPAEAVGIRSWFDYGGVLICRPTPGSGGRFGVALKGGHNDEHHNHNDLGSFVVVVGEQEALLDPGAEVYTGRTFSKRRYESNVLNSYGHPVPIVAGRLQHEGRDAQAEVLRAEFSDAEDVLALDLASAYEVPELQALVRTFTYSRAAPGSLTVTDEVRFSSPQAFGTALVTLGRWAQTGPGSLVVYDTESAVRVDVQVEGGAFEVTGEPIEEDVKARSRPTRIGINLTQPVAAARITMLIRPAEQTGPMPRNGSFEEGDWAWRVGKDGMSSISRERAAEGRASLRIVDKSKERGSGVSSARIPIERAGPYELRGMVLPVSGDGVGLYVYYLDKDGRRLNELVNKEKGWVSSVTSVGGSSGQWEPFAARFEVPDGTSYLQVYVHSYSNAVVEAYLDELEIVPVE